MSVAAQRGVLARWLVVVALVVGLSAIVSRERAGEEGGVGGRAPLALTPDTTVQELAEASGVPLPLLARALDLQRTDDTARSLAQLGIAPTEAQQRVRGAKALISEQVSKNWRMIAAKFAAWSIFLTLVFLLLRRRLITAKVRLFLLASSVLVFGILFGPSQSPMGTVKDAIALWARDHVIFLPRLIAFLLFLLGVVLANKFICAWGCQFGVLQDLLFRLGRDRLDRRGVIRQVKAPFVLSHCVRGACFIIFTGAALAWAVDLIEPVDPFQVYSPGRIGVVGGIFLGLLLVASIFIYRPWCHFLCPFGLVGWVAESFSLTHIRVNYDTCIACQQCARACPSTVMEAILKQDRVIPDCFACGVCLKVCPTQSISFTAGRRATPPTGKFSAGEAAPPS